MKRIRIGRILKYGVLFAYAFGCGMLFFGMNAAAYIDPSVMTYLIQAVAGVVIALGAVFGIYFRRVKKFFYEFFGIDQKRAGEVESDDIVYRKPGDDGKA